jgi:beta-mannosidase
MTVREANGGFEVEIATQALARFVWLELDGVEVLFSDNYFDLPAGRAAMVRFTTPQGWTVDLVRQALRVRSLVDSF